MISRDVFSKHKPNIKLATRFDGDGNEIQVEIREDVEQSEKLQEIIDILVAAGYFRARIKGLSSFDKVVGGMTWCIESCNYDIDVDLLFQENLTIGQKISLTEKIVAVLPKMSCPHAIEPHQIQGLDFINIFPVVQWLVKRSVESREERASRVRSFAVSQFDKTFYLQSERDSEEAQNKTKANLRCVTETYAPKRQYRRKGKAPEDEITRVQITLLEYGGRSLKVPATKPTLEDQHEVNVSLDDSQQDEVDVERLFGNMAEYETEQQVILDESEKAQVAEHYATLKAEMTADSSQLAAEKQIASITAQKQSLQNQFKKLQNDKAALEVLVEEGVSKLEETKKIKEEAETILTEIVGGSLDDDQQKALLKIQTLVAKNEKLREQEVKFKEQCKEELVELQTRIQEVTDLTPDTDNTEYEVLAEEERKKIQALKLHLARKTRSIAALQRQLDEIPGRAELAQYQRRFLELYNQVAAKHRETKQFYTLYNTLDDTKMYLSKELSLLNSVLDNYNEGMSSHSGREEFIQQFKAIVEGIKLSKIKVESRYNEERKRRDSLNEQLLYLVDQQRRYVIAVRQLTKECQRNEALLLQLKAL